MPTLVQFRRGNLIQNNSFVGAVGEITYDTTNKTIRVHDGSTAGGTTLLKTAPSSSDAESIGSQLLPFNTVWTNNLQILGNAVSSSTTTGSFRVTGGAGITGALYAGSLNSGAITANSTGLFSTGIITTTGISSFTSSTDSTSTTTGALTVTGGVGINGNLYASRIYGTNLTLTGNLVVQGSTFSVEGVDLKVFDSIIELHTQANSAPLIADDGKDIGIKFNYYKDSLEKGAYLSWDNTTGYLEYFSNATVTSSNVSGTYGTLRTGNLILTSTDDASSVSTGALVVSGGVGIGGNVYATVIFAEEVWSDGIKYGNGVLLTDAISTITSNLTTVDSQISSITANVTTLLANAAIQSADIEFGLYMGMIF